MTEGRQPFTAEIKTLAKGPSTYDPLENNIRKLRSLPDSLSRGSIRPSCRPVPWSLTAAEALAKFLCRPVRDDRVTFRGRMEGAAGRAARKVEHAEGTLIEVVLRPLIDGEKDVPAYAWFVWDRDASGSELKWFKPGYKARFS